MAMTVTGVVSRRSSVENPVGPPGEKEIQALNPARKERILEYTGWAKLEPGSLNLDVAESVLDLLLSFDPAITEPGTTIIYPEAHKTIPLMRKAYFYYDAEARANGNSIPVLVRRAEVPPRAIVELFAPENIRTTLDVEDGDAVDIILGLEADLLEVIRRDSEDNWRFFSNAGKGDRERWTVEEFLKHLTIEFAPDEVISLEEAHSTDVRFRDANFQVKEITTPDTRRQREFSEIARRVARAKRLKDTVGPAWGYDTTNPVGGDALVEHAVRELSADPRYFPSKGTTDLLFYVTHTGATLPSGWNLNAGALASLGWRSISCLIKDQSLVLVALQNAPEFLKRAATSHPRQ